MENKEIAIRNIVSTDDNIVQVINETPHTYNTILQEYKECGTLQVILRRRMNRLLKQSRVWRLTIPGTRFGLALFCIPEHEYTIISFNDVFGTKVYYTYELNEDIKDFILEQYWELKSPNWSIWEFSDKVIKIPKFSTRSKSVMVWKGWKN